MFQHCKRLLISGQKGFSPVSPCLLLPVFPTPSTSFLFLGLSPFLPPVFLSPGAETGRFPQAPWAEAWWTLSYSKESPTVWNCMLTCLRIVKKNSLSCVAKKLCVSEAQSQNIMSQISLGSFNSGSPRSCLNAGNTGSGASVNSFVPKMAMRMEAEGNVKCTGFHPCCHQNKNDLYFGPPGSTEMTCHLLA